MIRRKPRRDPVTPELHDEVIARDVRIARGCVAAFLDPAHSCQNRWGDPQSPLGELTLDHVQEGYGRMGKRAPSDAAHLVSLCAAAHFGGWASANKPKERAYLAGLYVKPDPLTLTEAGG